MIDANGMLTFIAKQATSTDFSIVNPKILIGTGSDTAVITGTTTIAINIASTTLGAYGGTFSSGTTTFLVKNNPEAMTLNGFYCTASTTGTVMVNFSHDNGNKTEFANCTTGAYTPVKTNNTWTSFEAFNVQASSTQTVSPPNRVTITAVLKKNSI